MKNIICSLLLFSTFFCLSQNIQNVDAQTFKKLVDEKKFTIIDLRTSPEIEKKGMIAGAIQIDYFAKDSEKEIGKLDKNKSYLIYCAGGGRSGECATLMQKLGFEHVTNLEKGFDDWKAKGYDVVKK